MSCCLEQAQRDLTTERFTSLGLVWKILKGMFCHSGNKSSMQRMENKTLHGRSLQLIYSCLSPASDRPQFMVDIVDVRLKPHLPSKDRKNKQSPALPLSSSWIFFISKARTPLHCSQNNIRWATVGLNEHNICGNLVLFRPAGELGQMCLFNLRIAEAALVHSVVHSWEPPLKASGMGIWEVIAFIRVCESAGERESWRG